MKTVIDNHEFITYKCGDAEFIFSTAKNNLNFNKNSEEGMENLKKLTTYFNLNDIGYLSQTHSSIIREYDGCDNTGDAIITHRRNIGIGVFTADCVPVLIYDKKKKVAAAVHSGWKGTSQSIARAAVNNLIDKYECNKEDITVYIGPHNRKCCYEFGHDAYMKFFNDDIYKKHDIYVNGKLNLEECIIIQLRSIGIPSENINTLNLCTYCNNEYEFYSFRREQNKSYGRMFSFIVIRE